MFTLICDIILKNLVISSSVHQDANPCITNQFIKRVINYYGFKILDTVA